MRIRPPFALYTLRAEMGSRNSPAVSAVHLVKECEVTGRFLEQHTLTPEQARELAAQLLESADGAERTYGR